jgi:putative membrane protein (TIGR04086 family)
MSVQTAQGIKKNISEHIGVFVILRGIIIAYLLTLPAFAIFALILTYSDFPEKYISTVVLITTIISILTAGSTATKNIRNKGWLNGAIVGAVYIIILYFLSSIAFKDFSINRQMILMFIIGLISGSIGGIIGINFKKPRRS